MKKKAKPFKRGDIVRVTSDVEKLIKTQWADEDFAKHAAGKEMKVLCSYKDGSYDLDGTALMLDSSVLEYVGHPKKEKKQKRAKTQ